MRKTTLEWTKDKEYRQRFKRGIKLVINDSSMMDRLISIDPYPNINLHEKEALINELAGGIMEKARFFEDDVRHDIL